MSDRWPHITVTGRNVRSREKHTMELIMKKIMSSLIALSVLAGIATSVAAQTKDDEDRADFWKYQERNLP
jgi:hypothetical protein